MSHQSEPEVIRAILVGKRMRNTQRTHGNKKNVREKLAAVGIDQYETEKEDMRRRGQIASDLQHSYLPSEHHGGTSRPQIHGLTQSECQRLSKGHTNPSGE